jgi:hypothetical protein
VQKRTIFAAPKYPQTKNMNLYHKMKFITKINSNWFMDKSTFYMYVNRKTNPSENCVKVGSCEGLKKE